MRGEKFSPGKDRLLMQQIQLRDTAQCKRLPTGDDTESYHRLSAGLPGRQL
jgi:hypothetical protein